MTNSTNDLAVSAEKLNFFYDLIPEVEKDNMSYSEALKELNHLKLISLFNLLSATPNLISNNTAQPFITEVKISKGSETKTTLQLRSITNLEKQLIIRVFNQVFEGNVDLTHLIYSLGFYSYSYEGSSVLWQDWQEGPFKSLNLTLRAYQNLYLPFLPAVHVNNDKHIISVKQKFAAIMNVYNNIADCLNKSNIKDQYSLNGEMVKQYMVEELLKLKEGSSKPMILSAKYRNELIAHFNDNTKTQALLKILQINSTKGASN